METRVKVLKTTMLLFNWENNQMKIPIGNNVGYDYSCEKVRIVVI